MGEIWLYCFLDVLWRISMRSLLILLLFPILAFAQEFEFQQEWDSIQVNIDGYNLPAMWYLPADFSAEKEYPVIFSVYGGPDSKNVNNSFPRWFTNIYLTMNDIIIFSVDHRGSGHFGRKGTDLMHRNLGNGKWRII